MKKARQLSFFPHPRKEHGGSLSVGARRSRRMLATTTAIHVTLKSDLATGRRGLSRHRQLIRRIACSAAERFGVRIYRQAICGNHMHLLIRGRTRLGLQNFFRVLAGHIAQEILKRHPLTPQEVAWREKNARRGCRKNQRRFWSLLLYSRLVSWGREFVRVAGYIARNRLEALHLIAYRERRERAPPPRHQDVAG